MTNEEMVAALRRKGIVVTPPARRVQSAPQRKTMAESSYGTTYNEENSEPLLSPGNTPRDWKALANPRNPWPRDLDPQQVLHELAPFMTYRLFEREAAGRGAPMSSFVDMNTEL